MPAALILPITGPYTGTWNAKAMGTMNDDGFNVSAQVNGQEINASDAYGQTLIEGVYRGTNWKIRLRGLVWNSAGLLDMLLMFGQANGTGTFTPHNGVIGQRYSLAGATLLLTAILGNPPTTPQTLTAQLTVLQPGQTSDFMFTSKLREMPLELAMLPYSTTIGSLTVNAPFTTT